MDDNLNVEIYYCTKITVCYDHHLYTNARPENLRKAIETAKADMRAYGYISAEIIDSETGEILAIIKAD